MQESQTELRLQSGETILLWSNEYERFCEYLPGFVGLLNGDPEQFPPFTVTIIDEHGKQNEFPPEDVTSRPDREQLADPRLFQFAHLARPFKWMDDTPRNERLGRLVADASTPAGLREIEDAPTQDLMDGLFSYARAARFGDGLVDGSAVELALVANEIRRRLINAAG